MYTSGFLKRNILNFVALVLGIAAICFAITTHGLENYAVANFDTVTACSMALLVLFVIKILVPIDELGALSVLYNLVIIALCMVCFYLLIMSRCELIGTIVFSSLDRSNPAAVKALTTGAIAFGSYGVAAFSTAINGFVA